MEWCWVGNCGRGLNLSSIQGNHILAVQYPILYTVLHWISDWELGIWSIKYHFILIYSDSVSIRTPLIDWFCQVCTSDDSCRYGRVTELYVYDKFNRVPADKVEAGDICAVCGITDIQVKIEGFG